MCGILGVSFQRDCEITSPQLVKSILTSLFLETQSRGFDATGVAFVSNHRATVLKGNICAKDFVFSREFNNSCRRHIKLRNDSLDCFDKTISIIGHCRFKTKGTPTVNFNNHPIVTENVIGVHNGIVSNDEQLFARYKRAYPLFGRRGKVDSEIIFQLIDHIVHVEGRSVSEAILKASGLINGSYACAFVDRTNPHQLWLFRDYSPITIFNYEDSGVIIFASEERHIETATAKLNEHWLGEPTEIFLGQQQCIGINLFTRSFYKFKLKNKIRAMVNQELDDEVL